MGETDPRESEIRRAINAILDPCSVAMTEPVGINDLGIVERVDVDGSAVRVHLLLTSPHCLYVGHFQDRIEAAVGALPGVDAVEVRLSDSTDIWDEGRMSEAARMRLARRRRRPSPAYLRG